MQVSNFIYLRFAVPLAVFLCAGAGLLVPSVAEEAAAPPHHADDGFINPNGAAGPGPADFFFDRLRLASPADQASRARVLGAEESLGGWQALSGDAVMWLGHASVLIRMGGVSLVVDPVFGARVSPLAAAGPARLAPSVLDGATMPLPDGILITHDHYDHFEPEAVEALASRGTLACVAPLKVALSGLGCAHEFLMDWNEKTSIGPVTITLLPAQHESGRGVFDRNTTLWASYLISDGARRVYVTGDTGYGPHLAEIGAHIAPVDLLVLSLGGYEPRDINKGVHMNPQEAARAAIELGARKILLVHWGTYPLGNEEAADAIADFYAEAGRLGINPATIMVLAIGGSAAF
ncbi:MAG TPA: MBL fold metallo-hydrolase [Micropepsaceae bacterium]|nr:MBL fold metallo-hydrolase [Micropepsaceae bacterium]